MPGAVPGGLGQVGLEQVLVTELGARFNTGQLGIGPAALHQRGIDLHAHAARAMQLCRRDHDAAVARSQIQHKVLRPDIGDAQHLPGDVVGRGDEGHFFQRMGRNGQAGQQAGGDFCESRFICHVGQFPRPSLVACSPRKSRKRRTAGTMPRRDGKTACITEAGGAQPGSTTSSLPSRNSRWHM